MCIRDRRRLYDSVGELSEFVKYTLAID
jgi:hypothetical protein